MEIPLGRHLRELPGPVLLTGHTGFKGTWMAFLLEHLNVPVVGYSLAPEKDSLYDRAERTGVIPEAFSDIRDYEALEKFIDLHKPSTVIHMAAQPLVLKSYASPRETFDVNVMGTVNLLDISFRKDFVKTIIIVTTDKVYRNDNSNRAFIETDPLEGKDPYSASKVGTEAVVSAWQQIAQLSGGPKIVSVRAGNVIGGGDFAEDRLIPDLVRGFIAGEDVSIRNPTSTRPWQHVLDPLIGYLLIIESDGIPTAAKNFNFGPKIESITVKTAALSIKRAFEQHGKLELNFIENKNEAFESVNLSLDSSNALSVLGWKPLIGSIEALEATANWWIEVLKNGLTAKAAVEKDLNTYLERRHE